MPQNVFFCDLCVVASKLASPFGHPTQVSMQVQLASTCNYMYFPVHLVSTLDICSQNIQNNIYFRQCQLFISFYQNLYKWRTSGKNINCILEGMYNYIVQVPINSDSQKILKNRSQIVNYMNLNDDVICPAYQKI